MDNPQSSDQAAKPRKQRKTPGAVKLYSVEKDGSVVLLEPQPPKELRDAGALKRWLKKTFEVSGDYVFLKEVARCTLTIETVTKKTVA